MDLTNLRLSYMKGGLLERDAPDDPFALFALWFEQARDAGNPEPNAMALSTASATGIPNSRMVLLKAADSRGGFVFYTSYESRKGTELRDNPRAALLFYWPELERQVRIQGLVERLSQSESESYFRLRPPGHQLGAWASHQSSVIPDRSTLDRNLATVARRFDGSEQIPLPPFWGGYRVHPLIFEFWQGRSNRLHDRLEYVQSTDPGSVWRYRRLSP